MPTESNGKNRPGTVKSARRREELRRSLPKPGIDLKALFLRRDLVNTLIIFTGFFIIASVVVLHSREQMLFEVGQVMTSARTKRVSFDIVNDQITEDRKRAAREGAPRVYQLNQPHLDDLRAAIEGLPEVVADKQTVQEIASEIAIRFMLTDDMLPALQKHVATEAETELRASTDAWKQWTRALVYEQLPASPTVTSDRFALERTHPAPPIFITSDRTFSTESYAETNDSPENHPRWEGLVRKAGFPGDVIAPIVAALTRDSDPTYTFDPETSNGRAEIAAQGVPIVKSEHHAGDPIYRPGDVLSPEDIAIIHQEQRAYREQASLTTRSVAIAGAWGVVGFMTILFAGYLIRFYPKVVRNPLRVIAIAGLSVGMLAVCVFVASKAPAFLYLAAIGTTLLVGMMMVIAYDQRLATMIGLIQCALVTFAFHESIAFYAMMALTNGCAVAWLREVRHRNTLIRAAAFSAGVAGVGAFLIGILQVPIVNGELEPIAGAWQQIWSNAGLGSLGALLVGFLLLGILPSVERLFDMTTGMTLLELRDTRQSLLRQLQERAPGTYNHSLQVATVAEAAAEAIGSDSLLTYVGGLYHDIGKMNKPDYFIENQATGHNKHEKLRPAMSLLVIVGHVKDGVELGKEYNLPRPIIHFIESHHGTTLVEYFYHQAKSQAEEAGDNAERVEEIEYRYPGPRPKTKEAAILMLSDAAESATRAMDAPTARGIETLVRRLSRGRLEDGQFDRCDLTLRELTLIEEAIVKAIISLYHSRIAYPKDAEESDEDKDQQTRDAVAKTA